MRTKPFKAQPRLCNSDFEEQERLEQLRDELRELKAQGVENSSNLSITADEPQDLNGRLVERLGHERAEHAGRPRLPRGSSIKLSWTRELTRGLGVPVMASVSVCVCVCVCVCVGVQV